MLIMLQRLCNCTFNTPTKKQVLFIYIQIDQSCRQIWLGQIWLIGVDVGLIQFLDYIKKVQLFWMFSETREGLHKYQFICMLYLPLHYNMLCLSTLLSFVPLFSFNVYLQITFKFYWKHIKQALKHLLEILNVGCCIQGDVHANSHFSITAYFSPFLNLKNFQNILFASVLYLRKRIPD